MALPLCEDTVTAIFIKAVGRGKSIAFLQNYCVLSFFKGLKFFLNA